MNINMNKIAIIDENLKSDKRKAKQGTTLDTKYDKNKYELGTQWALQGMKLEDAGEELSQNKSFINGFNRGERLKFIEEQDNTKPYTR